MYMKKRLLFMLCVLLMGAASCSGSDKENGPTENEDNMAEGRIDLNGKKVLIAYWSWSGNTEAVAKEIQRQAGGDLYHIQPLEPYGTTYQEVAYGGRTKDEADNDRRPALADTLTTVGKYDVIFIGSPVWWHMEARVVDTFCDLYADELKGKVVIPFCTFGSSYGPETIQGIVNHTPNSTHAEGYQSRGSNTGGVEAWLRGIATGKGSDLSTGISSPKAGKSRRDGISYTISGTRAAASARGIVITNGRKHISNL